MNQITSNRNEKQTPQPPPLLSSSSYSAGSSNMANEIIDTTNELSTLQCKHLLMQQQHLHSKQHFCFETIPRQCEDLWMENNRLDAGATLSYAEIISTTVSILFRFITVCINIKLAVDYYEQGHQDFFIWTVACIVTPMLVTMLIHANM